MVFNLKTFTFDRLSQRQVRNEGGCFYVVCECVCERLSVHFMTPDSLIKVDVFGTIVYYEKPIKIDDIIYLNEWAHI